MRPLWPSAWTERLRTVAPMVAAAGALSDGCTLLLHRRLAIIDPTPDGAQPMATPDGSHQLLFNGEVYNYRELRRDLESQGERFSSSSDTEVLLRLIVRNGPEALSRVRGMFALACWSLRDRSLLLARDRFGIKPLYVAATATQIAFSSEVAALRRGRAGQRSTVTGWHARISVVGQCSVRRCPGGRGRRR